MLTGVQKLINIKIAKAYRTVSNEALCIITGLKPIHIVNKRNVGTLKNNQMKQIYGLRNRP